MVMAAVVRCCSRYLSLRPNVVADKALGSGRQKCCLYTAQYACAASAALFGLRATPREIDGRLPEMQDNVK